MFKKVLLALACAGLVSACMPSFSTTEVPTGSYYRAYPGFEYAPYRSYSPTAYRNQQYAPYAESGFWTAYH
jgi:hypothetical protein